MGNKYVKKAQSSKSSLTTSLMRLRTQVLRAGS